MYFKEEINDMKKYGVSIPIAGYVYKEIEAESKEKTVSYTLENAKKKAYPKLAGELKAGIKNNLGTAFAL